MKYRIGERVEVRLPGESFVGEVREPQRIPVAPLDTGVPRYVPAANVRPIPVEQPAAAGFRISDAGAGLFDRTISVFDRNNRLVAQFDAEAFGPAPIRVFIHAHLNLEPDPVETARRVVLEEGRG